MMINSIKKFLALFVNAPSWVRGVVTCLVAIGLALYLLFAVTSCGSTTKAIIKNGAESTATTVSITTNNPTNWQVDPNVELLPKSSN